MKWNSSNIDFFFLLAIIFVVISGCSEEKVGSQKLSELSDNWKMSRLGSKEKLRVDMPSTVQRIMLENDKIPNPYYANEEENIRWMENELWEYTTWFKPGNDWNEFDHIELVFQGLDTYATIFLNDDTLFSSNNMFRSWNTDITEKLNSGRNELRIIFNPTVHKATNEMNSQEFELPASDFTDKTSLFCRKAPFHFGSQISPRVISTGVWKPIEIFGWNKFKVKNIDIQTVELGIHAKILAEFDIESHENSKLYVRIKNHDVVDNFRGYFLNQGENKKVFEFELLNAKYWWPRGYGDQHLYEIIFEFSDDPHFVNSWEKGIKTGLRKIELVEQMDEFGESFFFRVNNKPVFIKGAHYLPQNILGEKNSKEKMNQVLLSAYQANMNLIRVWGGGIYETNEFYEWCDSLGLMIWHDFTFPCGLPPASKEYLENVKSECTEQLKRLQHHPSISMWCGNEGIEEFWRENSSSISQSYSYAQTSKMYRDYEVIFKELLPTLIDQIDPDVPYLSSSPSGRSKKGDVRLTDFWSSVFTGPTPIPRFSSAVGFPSYPNLNTLTKYLDQSKLSFDSEILSNREKIENASHTIADQIRLHYRKPESFAEMIYYSQLLQAKFLEESIGLYRINLEECRGSIIWTLNDAWPGISFGSLDFEGKWKAAHYMVQKKYKPSVIVPHAQKSNLKIYLVSDKLEVSNITVEFSLKSFDGQLIFKETASTTLIPDHPTLIKEYDIRNIAPGNSKANRFLKIRLYNDQEILDEQLITFIPEKLLDLKRPHFEHSLDRSDTLAINLSTDVFAKNVCVQFTEMDGHFTDNFFDMEPDTTYRIQFIPDPNQNRSTFLTIKSLADY